MSAKSENRKDGLSTTYVIIITANGAAVLHEGNPVYALFRSDDVTEDRERERVEALCEREEGNK